MTLWESSQNVCNVIKKHKSSLKNEYRGLLFRTFAGENNEKTHSIPIPMKEVVLKTIEQNDNVSLYSICFNSDNESEFEKFLKEFKEHSEYKRDYDIILLALEKIIDKGALERFFRLEGGKVKALSLDSRSLRLYCLRISDQILIIGNGGVKKTRTFQETPKLNGYVMDLRNFDKALEEAQRRGKVTIEKSVITNIESATFTI